MSAVVLFDQLVPLVDSLDAGPPFGNGFQVVISVFGDGGVGIVLLTVRARIRHPVRQLVAVEACEVPVAFDAARDILVGTVSVYSHTLHHRVGHFYSGTVSDNHAARDMDSGELEDFFLGSVDVPLFEFSC